MHTDMDKSRQSVWDHAHHLKRGADPCPSLVPSSALHPQPEGTTDQLSVAVCVLPTRDTLHMELHYACSFVTGFFHLGWCFQDLLMYRIYQDFFPFYEWILFHWMDILHFAYSPTSWWTFVLFPHLALGSNSVPNICVQVFGWTYAFISLGYVPGKVMIVHSANWCLTNRVIGRLSSKPVASFSILPSSITRVCYSISLPTLVRSWLSDASHLSGFEMFGGFNFDSPMAMIWGIIWCAYWSLAHLLRGHGHSDSQLIV